jgi:hypothetical protein
MKAEIERVTVQPVAGIAGVPVILEFDGALFRISVGPASWILAPDKAAEARDRMREVVITLDKWLRSTCKHPVSLDCMPAVCAHCGAELP